MGNTPLGYHLCSVALHIGSGFLLWRIFHRLGLRYAWLGGFLFVIHPLAVESVAWISEIKNTLSLPLFLLAFDSWLDAEEKSTSYRRSVFYYLAAMLCKTSTVMLPLVLLLYCWWKRGRVTRQEILRVVPYLVIALVLGLVTIYFQNHGQDHTPIKLGGWGTRLIGAGTVCFFYAGKFFLPIHLLPIYPKWSLSPPTSFQVLTLPALAMLLIGLWMRRKTWGRHALFGVGFFLLNLLPVLGLMKMQYAKTSWVADHLGYLPMIGLVGLVVALCGEGMRQPIAVVRFAAIAILTVALSALAWKSHQYAALFSKQELFWRFTVLHNPLSPLARSNLGSTLFEQGRYAEAKLAYEQTLAIDPGWIEARNDLGAILLNTGQWKEAETDFRAVLESDSDRVSAHANLASLLARTGKIPEAIEEFQTALRLQPDDASRHAALGDLLMQVNRVPEAADEYQQALKLIPDEAKIHYALGNALNTMGREPEALEHYARAVEIDPGLLDAQFNLANALAHAGRLPEAIDHYQEAVRINPDYGDAHANLGAALLQLGRIPDAIAQDEQGLRINPKSVDLRLALGFALGAGGRLEEAAAQFEEVLKLDPNNARAASYLEKIKNIKPTAK